MFAWADEGWQVGEFSFVAATFFCERNSERRMIGIEATDPNEAPMFGRGYFGGCPTCRDWEYQGKCRRQSLIPVAFAFSTLSAHSAVPTNLAVFGALIAGSDPGAVKLCSVTVCFADSQNNARLG